jgi:hypothetical protein
MQALTNATTVTTNSTIELILSAVPALVIPFALTLFRRIGFMLGEAGGCSTLLQLRARRLQVVLPGTINSRGALWPCARFRWSLCV